jgi:hypothetical protein
VLSIPIQLMMGPLQAAFFERMLENARDIPREFREMLEDLRSSGFAMGVGTIAAFVGMLIVGTGVGAAFGAVGGILGAVIFRKNVPPPPPPPPPVPPTVWSPPPPPPPDVPGTV